jgi:cytosine/uracil/thiamine/allantoin permease
VSAKVRYAVRWIVGVCWLTGAAFITAIAYEYGRFDLGWWSAWTVLAVGYLVNGALMVLDSRSPP